MAKKYEMQRSHIITALCEKEKITPAEVARRVDKLRGVTALDPSICQKRSEGLQGWELFGLKDAQVIAKVGPLFTADQKKTGILASVSLAQFIMESNYGKSELAVYANNCFGIKTGRKRRYPGSPWDGISIYEKESLEEDVHGDLYLLRSPFRKYACIEDSIADHSALLCGSNLYDGVREAVDPKTAIAIIANAGYSTFSDYAERLLRVIRYWQLNRFDWKKDSP